MLTCPPTIVYEMCVDGPERRPDHVLAAKTFEGYTKVSFDAPGAVGGGIRNTISSLYWGRI